MLESASEAGLRVLALLDAPRLRAWHELHLSVGHVRYLQVLAEHKDSPTLSEISERIRVHPVQVTFITKRLSALGLISTAVDARDRRARRVTLTDEGRTVFRGQESLWRSCALALTADMEPDQARLLVRNLKRLTALPPSPETGGPVPLPIGVRQVVGRETQSRRPPRGRTTGPGTRRNGRSAV